MKICRGTFHGIPHGLYSVSIPRALAEAMGLHKEKTVLWSLERGDLVLRRIM